MDRRNFLCESIMGVIQVEVVSAVPTTIKNAFEQLIGGKAIESQETILKTTAATDLRIAPKSYTVCIANKVNKNNRLYPRKVLENCVEQWSKKDTEMLGMMGMPTSSIMQFSDVSHKVVNLRLEGNELKCEIEILKTPNGKMLEKLIKSKVGVEFRTAGIGNGKTDDNGVFVIDESFKLTSINALPLGEGS